LWDEVKSGNLRVRKEESRWLILALVCSRAGQLKQWIPTMSSFHVTDVWNGGGVEWSGVERTPTMRRTNQMVAEEDAPPLLIGKGVDSGSPSGETRDVLRHL